MSTRVPDPSRAKRRTPPKAGTLARRPPSTACEPPSRGRRSPPSRGRARAGRAARRAPHRRRSTALRPRPRRGLRAPSGPAAPPPAARSAARSAPLSAHPGTQPAGDLVVDRVDPPRHFLAKDPVTVQRADQHHGLAWLEFRLGAEVDREVVHADRPDHGAAPALHEQLTVV